MFILRAEQESNNNRLFDNYLKRASNTRSLSPLLSLSHSLSLLAHTRTHKYYNAGTKLTLLSRVQHTYTHTLIHVNSAQEKLECTYKRVGGGSVANLCHTPLGGPVVNAAADTDIDAPIRRWCVGCMWRRRTRTRTRTRTAAVAVAATSAQTTQR